VAIKSEVIHLMRKLLFLIVAILFGSAFAHATGSHEPRLTNWDFSSTYRVPFYSIKVAMKGDLELSEDDSAVTSIDTKAQLYIRETKGPQTAELRVVGTVGNEPKYTLWVNGIRRILTGSENQTIRKLLQTAAENFGVGGASKMDRYYREDGIEKALAVLTTMRSGAVVTYLFDRFTEAHEFDVDESIAIVKITGIIRSSSDLTATLIMLAERLVSDDRITSSLMKATEEIGSSNGASEAIIVIATRRGLRQDSAIAMAHAIKRIASSNDKREALETMASQIDADATVVDAFLDAATSIASSSDKTEAILALSETPMDDATISRVFETIESIASSSDKSEALTIILADHEITAGGLRSYLTATRSVSSSSDKAECVNVALKYVGERGTSFTSNSSLKADFLATIETISSSSDREHSLQVMIKTYE
jgi:hypothetical protein